MVLVGIDEVGRGPIAGPVSVGVFVCDKIVLNKLIKNGPTILKDSKKLTKDKREQWFKYIGGCVKLGICNFSVSSVSAKEIDKIGIVKSIQKAMDTSLSKLSSSCKLKAVSCQILLDGSLKAPSQYKNQRTIIKGDEKEPVIAIASIMAKVTRDRYMAIMAKKHPAYGFMGHVGYGTKEHYKAIKQHGITDIHRKTYLKNILA
ncbi:MAG: ribonuclease [Bacteroidota bacterium]|nr:ribonuclease [Bacteroidota bacterium]